MRRIFAVLRALIVAPLFISLWTFYLPRWIGDPNVFDEPQPLGWIAVVLGAVIGLPCVWQFAWRGLGTPFPLDPPRSLVISGPYRFVRNPMYIGMGLAMLGEAIVFPHSRRVLAGEMAFAMVAVALLVNFYEEPALRRQFGDDYDAYCRSVRRWIPRLTPWSSSRHPDE